MVRVKSIAEMGAYVSLLEYNGIEGNFMSVATNTNIIILNITLKV